jgi:hypothetical protein
MKEKLEAAVLGLVAVLSITVSVLDWLNWLPPGVINIPSLTLLTLGLISGYLVLERRSKLDTIEILLRDGPGQIIRSLDGVDVRRLSSSQEVYEYMAERIVGAEKAIDDLTFGFKDPPLNPETQKARERYLETIARVSSHRKKTISYREVMSFPAISHIARAEFMLSQELPGYRLRYYEFTQRELPALLSFMVVDSNEVIFAFYRAPYLPSEREILLAVRHPDLVKLFQDYFDAIWLGAKVLKEGDQARLNQLEEIEGRVRTMFDVS